MPDHPIDLGWMRIFVEVARLGSFSAAATLLGLTQPAVSYQIRRLEEQFGVGLLRRQHRGVALTAEGERLLEVAAKAVADIDALARRFSAEAQRPIVRLRTDYAFSSLWLIPRIDGFRLLHPETDIQIVATQRFAADFRDEADVAVVFGTRAEFGAIGTLLLREKVVPVCTRGFLDRNGPFDDPGQLAKAVLIHLDTPMPSPWFDWRSYLTEFSVIRDINAGRDDISFNTYSLVVQAALSAQGVAIGWMGLVDTLLSARMLVEAGPPLEAKDRGYWLVPPRSASAHSEKLSTWLMNEAGKVG
ncbi:putative choline sulfate-utilization transcription factor [Rhizobium leguminosarum]|uniref:HTH-type transcriptional regulator TtuA n=1 Tax=Rhizobium leguminosarum TaxID=384 RepID=A0AAE2MNA2_RHILE|nr:MULTISPECIES: LysR family transcriptional regulator [Rhizobium]MBB4292335.1 putative choline sulfate-utilization transcription factor [Rhizobium leguminosarum]MBB4299884.1 putative choline sulfate-utilization transcription factor [Rhizobium leguminosarum]MBB4309727.1 putative choline sulfate-utilization transcription factor [Rhizobium leguminosarum]MBB4419533.1 putative choline sulfate-utilization transcription factor [Rhizobium leguminosarum]MBB4434336.1 putative choline sulfate-utilizatio